MQHWSTVSTGAEKIVLNVLVLGLEAKVSTHHWGSNSGRLQWWARGNLRMTSFQLLRSLSHRVIVSATFLTNGWSYQITFYSMFSRGGCPYVNEHMKTWIHEYMETTAMWLPLEPSYSHRLVLFNGLFKRDNIVFSGVILYCRRN